MSKELFSFFKTYFTSYKENNLNAHLIIITIQIQLTCFFCCWRLRFVVGAVDVTFNL